MATRWQPRVTGPWANPLGQSSAVGPASKPSLGLSLKKSFPDGNRVKEKGGEIAMTVFFLSEDQQCKNERGPEPGGGFIVK